MLPVGKIRVSLVRLSPGDVPVTQEAVLAHGAAVSRGRYDKSFVKGKMAKLFRLPRLESRCDQTTSARAMRSRHVYIVLENRRWTTYDTVLKQSPYLPVDIDSTAAFARSAGWEKYKLL